MIARDRIYLTLWSPWIKSRWSITAVDIKVWNIQKEKKQWVKKEERDKGAENEINDKEKRGNTKLRPIGYNEDQKPNMSLLQ